MTKEIQLTESNIRLPPIEGTIVQEAYTIYSNMMNSAAKVFGKEICSLCAKQKGGIRTHFHGSEFGKCFRQTELTMINPVPEKNTGTEAISLHDGHLHEQTFRELLGDKYRLSHQDEEINITKAVRLQNNIQIHVNVIGHSDNILGQVSEYIDVYHNGCLLIEYKAVRSWYFKNRAKVGIISNHYYGQVQFYLEAYNLDYALLFFKNRETSEILPPFVIKRDPYYIKRRFTYLAGILYSMSRNELVPNEYSDPKCDACKFCTHWNTCWGE